MSSWFPKRDIEVSLAFLIVRYAVMHEGVRAGPVDPRLVHD